MEFSKAHKLSKPKQQHKANVSKETGFPSPATHYKEFTIDLNKELLHNYDATFFVRVKGNSKTLQIYNNDILIIDKSLMPKENNLALIITNGDFKLVRITHQMTLGEFIVWGVVTYIIHTVL